MRKKHLKIKLLKFQRFRDDVCFDDLNRTLHLARPSVKISGYLLSFRLKRQKNRKNRHFIHRQLAQATSTPQPAHPSRHTLAAAAAAARFWQAPPVVRSEQADQNDENRAREHCDIAVGVRHEDAKQQGACDRGGRVDVAYEYIWHIACHYIAEKAAADSSNDTDEDGEEYGRVLGNLKCAHGTGNGENTKTDRVGKQHNTAAALEKVSNLWNEHDETCEKCRAGGNAPRMMSRMIPPPTATVSASTNAPKISMFFLIPVIAPETANAAAPISSNTKMKISIYPPLSFFVVM